MPKRRKQRETRWTQQAIASAAVQVFARKGYHGATLEEIASIAGYTPPALYRYYASKDELYVAAIRQVTGEFMSIFDEPLPETVPLKERLLWFTARILKTVAQHGEYFGAMRHDVKAIGGVITEVHQLRSGFQRGIVEMMGLGIEQGALRGIEPEHAATAFLGLLQGFLEQAFESDEPQLSAIRPELIVDLFLHGAGAREASSCE